MSLGDTNKANAVQHTSLGTTCGCPLLGYNTHEKKCELRADILSLIAAGHYFTLKRATDEERHKDKAEREQGASILKSIVPRMDSPLSVRLCPAFSPCPCV